MKENKLEARELLEKVNAAIMKILAGGQSYKIGSRSMTRADLAVLQGMKKDLEAQVSRGNGTNLLDDTVVAIFDGR